MNPSAILSLISELYAQNSAQNLRIQELENALADKSGSPEASHKEG